MFMATTKTTPTKTNQNGSDVTAAPKTREAVELPTLLAAVAAPEGLTLSSGPKSKTLAPTPIVDGVRIASENKGTVYLLNLPKADPRVANKIIGLMRNEAKTHGVSLRTEYRESIPGIVYKAVDLITRTKGEATA